MPLGAASYSEALQWGVDIYHSLKSVLNGKRMSTAVGDEGGFAPDLSSNEEALQILIDAIEKAGLTPGEDISLALDVASTEFFQKGIYRIEAEARMGRSVWPYSGRSRKTFVYRAFTNHLC